MSRGQVIALIHQATVPDLPGLEPPLRQREFRSIRRARVSKALASEAGISGSLTRRMLRGERPVSVERFREWLRRLVSDGLADVARHELSKDAAVVGCALKPLPAANDLAPSQMEIADLCTSASELAAMALRHSADGDRSLEEIEAELEQINRTRRELDEAEAALLAEKKGLKK